MNRIIVAAALVILLGSVDCMAQTTQARVDRNVIYGMYSGLALLMDVYRPAKPNKLAIVAIPGTGFYAPMRYDAAPATSRPEVNRYAERLASSGYTVFVINHRLSPRFRYPAQVEDAQRAVRFVRSHAAEYGIDPDRIGAWGSSSGGYLTQLLGTMDDKGVASDSDPVNRASARVQAVVAVFAPSDLPSFSSSRAIISYMGFAHRDPKVGPPGLSREDDYENVQYREASPVTHVTSDDAPMLLLHGDADTVVPIEQSERMQEALKKAQVEVKFVRVPDGRHGPDFGFARDDPRLPDHIGAAVDWFDQHLKLVMPVR